MADPFIAEIRIFAGNFAPRGWSFCNGALLPIAQNTALFSLIGTTYGGDGRTTTALPNLQGRAPMHAGNGPGLTSRRLGDRGGTATETLSEAQLPNHNHSVGAAPFRANSGNTSGTVLAVSSGAASYVAPGGADVQMHADTIASTGGGQSHNNLQPYLAMNFIIALQGIFPSPS